MVFVIKETFGDVRAPAGKIIINEPSVSFTIHKIFSEFGASYCNVAEEAAVSATLV